MAELYCCCELPLLLPLDPLLVSPELLPNDEPPDDSEAPVDEPGLTPKCE